MRKRNDAYTIVKKWNIYILTFYDKSFFINMTSQNDLKVVYKDHYILRNSYTKKIIENSKEQGILPDMFFLEEFNETKSKAFSRMVAWAKLIRDTGYTCINGDTFNYYISNIEPPTDGYYSEIKGANLSDLLSKEKSLFPNYRAKKQETSRQQISIRLSPEEYEVIESKAKQLGMSKSCYVKQMALQGHIIKIEHNVSEQHLKTIREAIMTMQQAIVTIYKLGQYFPQDLEKIQNCVDEVKGYYKQVVKESIKVYGAIKKHENKY